MTVLYRKTGDKKAECRHRQQERNEGGTFMGFTELEQTGKQIFEQFPAVKRSLKRIYQLVSVALSNEKFRSEGNLIRVSPDDGYEYFYGYYDKSPWDAADRYMICMKVKQTCKSAAPKEPGVVGVIDTQDNNRFHRIGITHSWNVQQGCMAQWMGPDYCSRILYNDFRDGHYCAVIYNFQIGKEEKVLPMAAYDVARDGSYILSLDFSRLHRMRPGYGYSNLPETTRGQLCPDKCCIWKVDIVTEKITELFRYTDLAAFEPDESMNGAEHKVNHLMISPNCRRFMILHRWFQKGRKHTRLVTVNTDGTEMYNLSDDVFVSHCYWKNDEEILSFLRKKETGDHYYLMKDKTQEYKLYWPRLATDGHCSYAPNGQIVVTDSYPNRKRQAFIYLCKEEQTQPVQIGKVFSPFKYDNDCRCDLHPRWNRTGNKLCIDSAHEGKRNLYVINITKKDIPIIPATPKKHEKRKYKIVYVITNCKNSGPMNQTLNIIKNLDSDLFEPIVVTLFQEDLGNSVVQRFLDVVPEFFCLNMNKISSIIEGKKKLAKFLCKIKPDLIQGLGMPPYTMSLSYKNAVHLVTLRNYCYQDYPDKYGKHVGKMIAQKDMHLISQQIKKGETFITCSQSLSKIYREKHGLELGVIRNGVDVWQYGYANAAKKKEMKMQLKLSLDKITIACSGQFIDRKDQKFAIEGILSSKFANKICMVLMGSGPNLKALSEKYADDDRLLFTGNINNVCDYLQASDAYVSASKSEGMPNGVLEAMATGLPVLLSDIPQHLEVLEINDQYGLSYHLGDRDDFINKFEELINRNLEYMGIKASKTANNEFSAEIMSKRYQELYLSLINKKQDTTCIH